ncbi:MAG: hypothetical protein ACOWWO_17725 [Peptococcaceae bacterium]
MKNILNWQVLFGLLLIVLSALVYFIHYLIFRDAHHIFIYLIGDIAFVFFEVLLVTLVIHQLLHYREKKSMLNKLNMVIGAFFSEVGSELVKTFLTFDVKHDEIARKMRINSNTFEGGFSKICDDVKDHPYDIDIKKGNLKDLKSFLKEKRQFLLNLLENPNLLEHDSFTNLLWAVFHLTEELVYRKDLSKLPETDYEHLAGDMERVYHLLVIEWLDYMKHLKGNYPYLFSLAVRTNPFDANASVEVR